mgnify:CR=1 FL=1
MLSLLFGDTIIKQFDRQLRRVTRLGSVGYYEAEDGTEYIILRKEQLERYCNCRAR